MSNHPNRSKNGKIPTNIAVERARKAAGLTIEDAARLVYVSTRAWENWETSQVLPSWRPMPQAAWELFLIKTGQIPPPKPIKK